VTVSIKAAASMPQYPDVRDNICRLWCMLRKQKLVAQELLMPIMSWMWICDKAWAEVIRFGRFSETTVANQGGREPRRRLPGIAMRDRRVASAAGGVCSSSLKLFKGEASLLLSKSDCGRNS
jgi:hypothetical protein